MDGAGANGDTCLFEIQHAELGFLSELPLALRVGVVELPRQLLRVLVLRHRLGLVGEARRLGRAVTGVPEESSRRTLHDAPFSSCRLTTHPRPRVQYYIILTIFTIGATFPEMVPFAFSGKVVFFPLRFLERGRGKSKME